MENKKNVFLWALYDFANTPLPVAIGGLYLAQWVILDNKLDDLWYGGIYALSTFVLLLTSPFLGAWSDKMGKRMPFIKWSTIILILFGSLLGLVAVSSIPKIPKIALVLIFFFFVQYFYQIGLIFYNALLKTLTKPETMAKISGFGQAFGEAGWLLGPAVLLPFATGQITIIGEPGRGQVFFPSVLILILLGMPMVLWFKEKKLREKMGKVDFKIVYSETIKGFKSLIKENKNVFLFLVGFMFVSDALLTAALYFAIYLDQIFQISDTQKFIVLAIEEIFAIPSAYFIGKIGDYHGVKKILLFSCLNLILVFLVLSSTSSLTLTYVLASLIGLGFGGFYTTSRVLLIKISPVLKLGEYFGFYSTFQKFASIVGPLVWGLIILLLKESGVLKYRVAILALTVLMIVGTLIFTKVKEEREIA